MKVNCPKIQHIQVQDWLPKTLEVTDSSNLQTFAFKGVSRSKFHTSHQQNEFFVDEDEVFYNTEIMLTKGTANFYQIHKNNPIELVKKNLVERCPFLKDLIYQNEVLDVIKILDD